MRPPNASRRAIVPAAGGPEVLALETGPVPEPKPHQVRVRVHVAGVAFGDVMRRRGVLAPRHPFTPGYDVAGEVDALGDGVHDVRPGDRVAVLMPKAGIGGYADHVCVPAKLLVPIPAEVPFDEAVCLGLNYITAYQLIHRMARSQPGDRVLIHGAAGGVGTALLDLGRLAELTMYGTASAAKHELVRERGGIPIDYRNQDFVARLRELEPGGLDAVFDGIGGDNLSRSYQTLNRGGVLVAFGVLGDVEQGVAGVAKGLLGYGLLKLRFNRKRTRFYAITASPGAWPAQCRRDWATLLDLRRQGELSPVIGARLPLERVGQAHDLMDRSAVAGKILLTCT